MVSAYVGLGANLGDPLGALRAAARALSGLPGVASARASSLYRTSPVEAAGPDFFNAVLRLECRHTSRELFEQLRAIERDHGRERPYRNAPRTLDLDLLLWGEQRIDEADLTVPHPRMHLRAFVLAPLTELDPAADIPGRGPAARWLDTLRDQPIARLDDPLF